jgi:site-specific DNA-adenine methylase
MKFFGGKGKTFQQLINLMPPHEVYIETHLGGGSVIRNKRLAKRNIGIEIDPKVFQIWPEEEKRPELELIQADAVLFLKTYQFTGNEMVYCDPPYLRETRRNRNRKYYRHEYCVEQHLELLEVIKTIQCMVMISGYESELYKEILTGWHIHTFDSAVRGGVNTEWVWMNYPEPIELHDYRFLGNNFRERERLKRRKENWVSRLQCMPVLERQALLCAMQSVNGVINDGDFASNR